MIDSDQLYESLDKVEEKTTEEALPELLENEGKTLSIELDGVIFERFPVKTHLITGSDNICEVAERYAKPYVSPDDILFVSKKAVSCSQGRAIPVEEIDPGRLAFFLSSRAAKRKGMKKLSRPETMEMIIRECGAPRVLLAALVGAVGAIFRKNSWFYIVAGKKAYFIDGPSDDTIPPYDRCVILSPDAPDKVAQSIQDRVGCRCIIVDISDRKQWLIGASSNSLGSENLMKILADNPLDQGGSQTPMGIIRAVG